MAKEREEGLELGRDYFVDMGLTYLVISSQYPQLLE